MSKISIVILNYNDYKTTTNMIEQIKSYKILDHIIIVDNKSSDNSYSILKKYENNNIKVIQTKSNKGYASGNNYGIKYVIDNYNDDYILISNPDIIVDESVIIKLKSDLDNNLNISLVAPRVHEFDNISRGWMLPDYYNELITISNTKQRFHKKYGLYDEEHYNSKLSEVDVVSGSFFMIRTSSLKLVNYFDPNTFLYYEENILGYKLKSHNLKTYVDNEVDIIHNLSVSVDKSLKKIKKYKILVKSLIYYEKTYMKRNILSIILLYIVYYISLLIAYIINIFRGVLNGSKK